MNCDLCGGELYADSQSITDMARFNLDGGRITCRLGCTSIWLVKPKQAPGERPVPLHKYYKEREITCQACGAVVIVNGNNAKRCATCRAKGRRLYHAKAQRRYEAKHRIA